MARAASTSEQSKGDKRPFMRKWQCAQIVDGKPCNASNFHYAKADQYDTTLNTKCARCGNAKKVARANDVAKALAAMQAKLDAQTEQMAKLQQYSTTVLNTLNVGAIAAVACVAMVTFLQTPRMINGTEVL